MSSSIYATPLITDLYSDGHKDIIVPSFVHYLDVSLGLPPLRPRLLHFLHRSPCLNVDETAGSCSGMFMCWLAGVQLSISSWILSCSCR